MKKNYHCPHCRAILNPNVKIIFVVVREERRGLMLLNAARGLRADRGRGFSAERRRSRRFPLSRLRRGSGLRIFDALREIVMSEGSSEDVKVEFSRIYGEHATFIVDGKDVTSFGENAHDFQDINFFGH